MLFQKLKIWVIAARPKTLPAVIAPVMVGLAFAWREGHFAAIPAVLTVLTALLIQIGTNFVNDYFDFIKGADGPGRIGPLRVMQAGMVSESRMRMGIFAVFFLASILALPLIARAGWPILVIGSISILLAFAYTAGPWPLAYFGMGDIFVLIFFGPVAVAGTYYVQAGTVSPAVLLAGLPMGLLSMAILTVNNLRDIDTDTRAGKRTLAVRFGRNFSRFEYIFSLAGSTAIFLLFALLFQFRIYLTALLCGYIVFFAVRHSRVLMTSQDGHSLNALLAATGKLTLFYGLAFTLCLLL